VWSQQGAKLVSDGGGIAGTQGQSVAISTDGAAILIGASGESHDAGAAWVYGLAHFQVITPAAVTAGVPFQFSAALLDAYNSVFTGYNRTVHFTSSDARADLPADQQFFNGTGTFLATLRSPGNQMIAVSDLTAPLVTGSSAAITVTSSGVQATHFAVLAPSSATTDAPFNFTVTALDANNQPVSTYPGTVRFGSTDPSAILPAAAPLVNGSAVFSATFRTTGTRTITAMESVPGGITGTSNTITVAAGIPAPPTPASATPSSGNTATGSFFFRFTDTRGYQDFDVVNILINSSLDGRNACYLAYSRPLTTLYLVGDNGGLQALPGGSSGSVANSQCSVSYGMLPVDPIPNTLFVDVNITFQPSFGGNKVIYMAARDVAGNNSGWQALGVWQVPGGPTQVTSVQGMTPAQGQGLGPTPFSFTFRDTRGFEQLGVENILVNSSLDGRQACYLAYSRPLNMLYLVNDNGDALLAGQSLAAAGTLSNSQCAVSWVAGAVSGSGTDLTLNLSLRFFPGFTGNKVVYLAARDVPEVNNSGWQASGTVVN
jgi:hypothetical protein